MGGNRNRKHGRYGPAAALLLGTALATTLGAGHALAQQASAQQQVSFDIPAQPLSSALVVYGRQAGLQVSVDADAVRGIGAPAVRGALAPGAALDRLLGGSGLVYRMSGRSVVVASRAAAPSGAVEAGNATVLDTIDVTGTGGSTVGGTAWRQARDEVYQTAASVAEVNPGTITSYGHNLNNAVRSVAGVYSWENAAQPGMAVNIRGLEGMGRVTSTIDGVRQNYRFTGHGPAGYTYVEPSLISGIDITKGAIATAGGAGTLAGAINYRTLTIDDVLNPHEKIGGQVTATFGGNDGGDMSITKAGGMRFDLAGNPNGGSVFGALNFTGASNYRDGNGNLVGNSWREVRSGLLKASLAPNDEHRLDLGGVFYTADFSANFYSQTVTNRTLTAKYAYTPDSDLIDLRVNGYLNRTESKWRTDPNSSIVVTTYDGRVMTTDALGLDVSNTSKWDFGDYGLKLDYGVEYYRDDFSGNSKADANPDGVSGVGGGFVQATLAAGMFEFIPGLRYDLYSMKSSGTTGNVPDNYWTIHDSVTGTSRDALTRPSNSYWNNPARYTITEHPFDAPWRGDFDIDETKFKLNPKLTLAAKPLEWLQVYGTWEQSFRAPTVNEMFFGGSHGGGVNATFLPNPALRPEEAKGWEIGANILRDGVLAPEDSLRVKAALYEKDVENYIISHCFASGSMCWFENAPGTSRLRGFEIDASYDVGWGFAGLSFARNRSDLQFGYGIGGMGEPSRLPDDYMTLTAGLRLLDRRLTLGARMNDVSKGTLVENSWETSAYTTYDLFMNYRPSDRLNVFANVTNLTDVNYMPAMSQDRAPGRRIFGGATVKFGEGSLFGDPVDSFLGLSGRGVGENPPADIWSGACAGLSGGYSWGETDNTGPITFNNWPAHNTRPVVMSGNFPTRLSGHSLGVFAGYNFHIAGGLVAGVDASLEGRRNTATGFSVPARAGVSMEGSSSLGYTGALRGRLGYAIGAHLPYVSAGVGIAEYEHKFDFSGASTYPNHLGKVPQDLDSRERYVGFTIGFGMENMLMRNLVLRSDYRYSNYGSKSFSIDGFDYDIRLDSHDLSVGIAYKF